MPSDATIRGRANRAKGVRFERTIARKLRAEGFVVRRNLEFDGYGTGIDLHIGREQIVDGGWKDVEWLPIALQCKATANHKDGVRGWWEAREAMPEAQLVVCFHSIGRCLLIYAGIDQKTPILTSWDELVAVMKRIANGDGLYF